jgi:hypothetical protein
MPFNGLLFPYSLPFGKSLLLTLTEYFRLVDLHNLTHFGFRIPLDRNTHMELLTMHSKATLVLLLAFFALAHSLHLDPRDLNAPFLPCYDYIIVGGGISGLVVANRLTEDPNGKPSQLLTIPFTDTRTVTVLVLEAGDL